VLVGRVMATILYGVDALDPVTFVIVPIILLSVAFLAAWLPARRAARVDPVVALRTD
jgi:putative ABC transport system permease protein